MFRNVISALCVATILSGICAATAAADELIVDDFESYEAGQIIGPGPTSKPWKRFGDATNDNLEVVAQPDRVISGSKSVQYCVFWPNKFGGVRYTFEKPMDLTNYVAVSFKVRSLDVQFSRTGTGEATDFTDQTRTTVTLTLTNGPTIYEAVVAKSLSSETQTYTIFLTEGILVPVEGSQSFTSLLEGVTELGLTFRSTSGQYTETLIIDDIKLLGNEPLAKGSRR